MLLIDTNIFLELLLGQEKADECQKFLEMVSEGELEAVATKFSIHAIEAILNDSELILIFLRNLQNSIGLHVYETSIDDEIAASMLMKKLKLDFNDSLQYYVAKKLGVKAIVSYDKHFDIRRLIDLEEAVRKAEQIAKILEIIKLENIASAEEFKEVMKLAAELKLTFYDASYLQVAKKMGIPLVTEDKELLEKAKNVSVKALNVDEFLKTLRPRTRQISREKNHQTSFRSLNFILLH